MATTASKVSAARSPTIAARGVMAIAPVPATALVLSEGASLVVIYSNPCIPRAAQLYISLGPRQFSGPHSVTHFTLPAINGNLPNLKHSRIGADGQVGGANCGLRAIPQITDERTWIENPITAGSIQIKGDVAGSTEIPTGMGMTASHSISYGIRIPMCLGMALSLRRAADFNTACDTYRKETVSSGLLTFSVFVS